MFLFVRLLVLLALCISVGQGLYFLRKGFSLRRVECLQNTYSDPVPKEIQEALRQPFDFLGKGRQCFAFVSRDGKYILKLPRTNIYRLPLWSRLLPCKQTRERLRKDKAYRKNFVFNSFHIALEKMREETGILALHLGESKPEDGALTLIDPLGVSFRLPVHRTMFVLQERKNLWTPAFLQAMQKENREEQKKLLNALVDAVVRRASKGILNRDRSFLNNYGFDGAKAYQIDVGDFYELPTWHRPQVFDKSARDSLAPVEEWLAKINPPMLTVLQERLDKLEYPAESKEY